MENFSDAVQNAIQNAFQKAKVNDNPEVTENHLLLSFLEDPQGYFHTLLDETKGDTQQLISDLSQTLAHLPKYTEKSEPPKPARDFQSRVVDAQKFATELGDLYVSSDHFLLSYWKGEGEPFATWKKQTGISSQDLKVLINKVRGDRHMDSP